MHLEWKDVTANRHAGRVFHGQLEPKISPNFCVRKEGPREAKMEPKWSQDEANSNALMRPRGRIEGPREAKMEPKWSQDEAKSNAKMGPRGRKEGPREAKMEPKWSQDEAKRGQDGPRGAKRGQDGAKMGPRRNQHGAKIEVQKTLKKTVFWAPEPGSKTSRKYRTVCIFRSEEGFENDKKLEKKGLQRTPFWGPK